MFKFFNLRYRFLKPEKLTYIEMLFLLHSDFEQKKGGGRKKEKEVQEIAYKCNTNRSKFIIRLVNQHRLTYIEMVFCTLNLNKNEIRKENKRES